MAEMVNLVSNDNGVVLGVELSVDGAVVNLTTATIEAHLVPASGGTATTIAGVTGDANGVCLTELAAAQLVPGRFLLEHEVTIGSTVITYPSRGSDRIQLMIRTEGA